jgi:hypothetical protein
MGIPVPFRALLLAAVAVLLVLLLALSGGKK